MSKMTERFLIDEIHELRRELTRARHEINHARESAEHYKVENDVLEDANAELVKDIVFLTSLFERKAYIGADGQMHRYIDAMVCDGTEEFARLDEYMSGFAEEVKSWGELEQEARD